MPCYEKNDVSEGIDTNKTSTSKKCMLCHYLYFRMLDLNLRLTFVVNVRICINDCIAIQNVQRVGFSCVLWGITKNEDVIRLNNSVSEDEGVL